MYKGDAISTMRRIDEYRELVARLNSSTKDSVFAEYGRRYVKISNGNRVHSFVVFNPGRTDNGDILKAATFRAPAKNGRRGNIWSEDVGESIIDWHGTKLLR